MYISNLLDGSLIRNVRLYNNLSYIIDSFFLLLKTGNNTHTNKTRRLKKKRKQTIDIKVIRIEQVVVVVWRTS